MKYKKIRFFKVEAARRATQTKTTKRVFSKKNVYFQKKAARRATQTKTTKSLFKKHVYYSYNTCI